MAKKEIYCECERPLIGRRVNNGRIKLPVSTTDSDYSRIRFKCRACGGFREFLASEPPSTGRKAKQLEFPLHVRVGVPEKRDAAHAPGHFN